MYYNNMSLFRVCVTMLTVSRTTKPWMTGREWSSLISLVYEGISSKPENDSLLYRIIALKKARQCVRKFLTMFTWPFFLIFWIMCDISNEIQVITCVVMSHMSWIIFCFRISKKSYFEMFFLDTTTPICTCVEICPVRRHLFSFIKDSWRLLSSDQLLWFWIVWIIIQ